MSLPPAGLEIQPDSSFDPDLEIKNEYFRYNFIISSSIVIVVLALKAISYYRAHKRDALSFKTFQHAIITTVNRSFVVYISDKPVVRMISFFYGLYPLTLGYPLFLFLLKSAQLSHSPSDPTNKRLFYAFGNVTCYLLISGANIIQLFLIVMIGAKDQMILNARNPLDSTILSFQEKSRFVRSNLKRVLAILLIIIYLPLLPYIFDGVRDDVRKFFQNGICFYFLLDRYSFLIFEKHAIKLRAASSKIILKFNAIKKYLHDYSPKAFVQAVDPIEEVKVMTHQDQDFLRILDHTLQTIDEDRSVPMMEVTGEIHILSKLFLLVSSMIGVLMIL